MQITCVATRTQTTRHDVARYVDGRQRRRGVTPPRAFGVDVSQFEGLIDSDTGYKVVYGGLGVMAASFAATFFVAPRFRTQLKEAEDWKDIYTQLVNKGTQSITPFTAAAKLSNPEWIHLYQSLGTVLLDVGLASRFEQSSAKNSVNIPLYQPIQGWDPASFARRLGFAFFGIPGTERNPKWLTDVEDTIAKDREVIVLCELGGTLEAKVGMKTGFQSRSLKAAHLLQEAGYQNVLHLKGGISEWIREELPLAEGTTS